MTSDLHLIYPGTCDKAFTFYEKVFGAKRTFSMTFGDAPPDNNTALGDKDLIMHTAMPLGSMTLMGCDAPTGRGEALGGFQISLSTNDEAEVKRLFGELSEGGSVMMPPTKTFWSPLFCMFKDQFGVGWMVSIPGQAPQ
jgi:PhnB protein